MSDLTCNNCGRKPAPVHVTPDQDLCADCAAAEIVEADEAIERYKAKAAEKDRQIKVLKDLGRLVLDVTETRLHILGARAKAEKLWAEAMLGAFPDPPAEPHPSPTAEAPAPESPLPVDAAGAEEQS